MNRSQLAHVLRAAADVAGDERILVIGSQAILASYDAADLPTGVTLSVEADAPSSRTMARPSPTWWTAP